MQRVGIRVEVHEDILLYQALETVGSSKDAGEDLSIDLDWAEVVCLCMIDQIIAFDQISSEKIHYFLAAQ